MNAVLITHLLPLASCIWTSNMHQPVDQVSSASVCLPYIDVSAHAMSRFPWPGHVSSSLCQVKALQQRAMALCPCCSFLVHRALRPYAIHSHHRLESAAHLVPHRTMMLRPWLFQLARCTRFRRPHANVGRR